MSAKSYDLRLVHTARDVRMLQQVGAEAGMSEIHVVRRTVYPARRGCRKPWTQFRLTGEPYDEWWGYVKPGATKAEADAAFTEFQRRMRRNPRYVQVTA